MAIWMALSATAANADNGAADNQSILGGVTSNVSAAVSSATGAVGSASKEAVPQATAPTVSVPIPNVPLPAPVKAIVPSKPISVPIPAVTPIVQQVGGSVDTIVETVPVVNHVIPTGPADTVVDAVVPPVTGTVDQTVSAVVPPVNEALKPVALEPVIKVTTPIVQPIVDVVDKVLPPVAPVLPPATPVLPPLPGGVGTLLPEPSGDAAPGVGTIPDLGVVSSPKAAAPIGATAQAPAAAGTGPSALAATPSTANQPFQTLSISRVLGSPNTASAAGAKPVKDPTDLPAGLESVPAGLAGVGSGNSQNGPPSPAAAFLHGALIIPADFLTDLVVVSDEQHPKPVCFDPGSSPD
ncbi:hypothetical protein QF015_001574 [Paenarthrobacter sp. TE4293]|uniref:hypothetical protein n=1 Tax=Paenarthrobacter sp. TE4293 TaxID=3381695 RepID=UPI003D1FA699